MKKRIIIAVRVLVLLAIGTVALIRPDIPVEKLKSRYADAASRFVTVDGLTVHFKDEGQGYPLVLLHGAASSLQAWDGWAKELRGTYRVIRLDLPGYGLTGPSPEKDYSMGWYARFLDDFLEKNGISECYLAGNSLGGRIAIEYAAGHPDVVKKLVLVDAVGYRLKRKHTPLVAKMASTPVLRTLARYATPRFFVAMNVAQAYGDRQKLTKQTINRYYDLMRRKGNRDTFLRMQAMDFGDSTDLVRSLEMPVLVMWGARDRTIPLSQAERLRNDLPDGTLVVYDTAGHMPMEELPDKTALDVRTFLQ